jgi:hypothetical protein
MKRFIAILMIIPLIGFSEINSIVVDPAVAAEALALAEGALEKTNGVPVMTAPTVITVAGSGRSNANTNYYLIPSTNGLSSWGPAVYQTEEWLIVPGVYISPSGGEGSEYWVIGFFQATETNYVVDPYYRTAYAEHRSALPPKDPSEWIDYGDYSPNPTLAYTVPEEDFRTAIGAAGTTNLTAHVDDTNNPHAVTPAQIGALGTNHLTQTVTTNSTEIPSGAAVTDALAASTPGGYETVSNLATMAVQPSAIVPSSGTGTNLVMSQAAVTDALAGKANVTNELVYYSATANTTNYLVTQWYDATNHVFKFTETAQ